MKKLWIILFSLLLLLCSCQNTADNDPDTDENNPLEGGTEDIDPIEETTYEDIERRQAISYKTNYYGMKKDSTLLKLELPTEWVFSEADDEAFDILRDGEIIGFLIAAPADDADDWTALETESCFLGDVRVTEYIEQKNGYKMFRYRYVYDYSTDGRTRTVTLIADCAEIDKKSERKLYENVIAVEKVASDTVGALSSLGNPSSILILGNSFINTSDIGSILSELFRNNGKDCSVEAISRGYATVETYANDVTLLDSIRKGTYDAVFICGFYKDARVEYLGIIKDACDASATKLIIFPAHNERYGTIAEAVSKYPSLFCLNWREEIVNLIIKGVDRWDLCLNDRYKHSSPLAGYVGAHMIYRAIYNELPTEPMQDALSQSYIDGILGEYAYVGDLQIVEEDEITYFD